VTADAVVIGAGVMGASIAFHLARRGLAVTVVDKGRIAGGATSKSGALVRLHYANRPEAALARAAFDTFLHWRDVVGGDCGFRQTGMLWLVPPQDIETLRAAVAMQRSLGIETQVVEGSVLAAIQPHMDRAQVGAASFEPFAGFADPVATTRSFLAASGATVLEYTTVSAISASAGRATGVETSAGPISAGAVICAAGPWTVGLLRPLGVDLPVWPERAQIAFVERPPALAEGHRTIIDVAAPDLLYTRPAIDGTTLAGLHSRPRPRLADPDHYDERLDPGFGDLARDSLARRLPPFAALPVRRGHAGFYDMSPDGRAVLDRVADGLWFCAGFSGTGFKKSPAVGACLAEWIVDGAPRTADLHPFRLSRFAEGDPITDEFAYTHLR
jgi:sarcosine oxidase, subunit beta